MCGRFSLTKIELEIEERFGATFYTKDLVKRYNVAPAQSVPVITIAAKTRIDFFRWGFIPAWATDDKMSYSLINAQSEKLLVSRMYREAFLHQRCLVPADGFYEWQKVGKQKIPYRIHLKGDKLFAFAGLYSEWKNSEGKTVSSFTIITTTPNKLVAPIHNRMPVILQPQHEKLWLDKEISTADLIDILLPYDPHKMEAYTVSTLVNNVANDTEKILEEVKVDRQQSLF